MMRKAELLDQLNRPRTRIDSIVACIAVLGLLGCFSESQTIKTLSLSTLFGSVGALLCNIVATYSYADAALVWFEKNLNRHRHLLSLSEEEVQKLKLHNTQWEEFARQKCNEVGQLKLQLQQVQEALRNTQEQARETNYQRALLQNKVDTLQEQIQWLKDCNQ